MTASRQTDLIDALVRLMYEHDRDTAEHLEATGRLAEQTARAMALDAPAVARCRDGARLHDIGMLDLDTRMLHPHRGEALLQTIPLLAGLAAIVGAHHERVDGQGYPNRLSGSEIPLESRIIAVADAFHSMICRRWDNAMPVECALLELTANAGTQFDAAVVRTFVTTLSPTYRIRYRAKPDLAPTL